AFNCNLGVSADIKPVTDSRKKLLQLPGLKSSGSPSAKIDGVCLAFENATEISSDDFCIGNTRARMLNKVVHALAGKDSGSEVAEAAF
ncbi:MAG: hypothetical protein JWN45_493, partial [Acidobacteriaceae bacterium]|nr:hypothetical protein [Acidobacteriaceae bacterium]